MLLDNKNNKIHLCYVNMEDLWQWIEENDFFNQNFTSEKEKWAKEVNQKPNFFSDTELILIYRDILILKVPTDNQVFFLVKTYQLEYQVICQRLFQANENIILISERQWKIVKNSNEESSEPKEDEKMIILFKDEENAKKSLTSWLKEITI